MERINAKVTARGFRKGKPTTIICIEYGGGGEEEGVVKVFKDGIEMDAHSKFMVLLDDYMFTRAIETPSHCYNPSEGTIEAYWLSLQENQLAFNEKYFDEPPDIEVEGELDTFGSPYSNEDTSGVVF